MWLDMEQTDAEAALLSHQLMTGYRRLNICPNTQAVIDIRLPTWDADV